MTRKSLAIGAAFALTATGLVASPALAANEVSLAVNGGTGTTTILGEAFSLKATVGALVPDSSNNTLKFLVANETGAALTYAADAGTPGATGAAATAVDGSAGTSSSGTSDSVNGTLTAGTTSAVFEDNQTLSVASAATTAHSVVVTAWLDSDGSGTINNAEFASAPVTVNFVKLADAGISVSMKTAPQLGDSTFVAKITSSVINVAQVNAANLGVQAGIYVAGTKTAISAGYTYGTLTAGTLATRGVAVSLNSDQNALESAATAVAFDDGAARTAFTSGNYVAQAIHSSNPGTAAWVAAGSEASFSLSAAQANAANSSEAVTAVAGKVTAAGAILKDYKGDVVYSVTVKDADKAVLANRVVRLTVTTETGTWTVNGASVASAGNYDAITNASGVATFVFKSTNGAVTDALAIGAIVAEGVEIEALADTTNLAYSASTWTAVETTAGATSQTAELTRAVDAGSAATMSFRVVDQFGNAFADAAYRVKASVTGRTVTTLTDGLDDGVASFTVPDGANTSGDTTVAFTYEKLASGVWGANTDITALSNRVIKYYSQANTVAITETTVSARAALEAATAVDARTGTATVFDTAGPNSDEQATINGSVTNTTTSAKQLGALITVSGNSSLLFQVNDVYAFGTLTFFDADGDFAINIYSNKAQTDSVVTVTSADGGSDTVKVSFAGVATNAGKTLTIEAPTSLGAGSTMQATITLLDVYGNGVDTNITATDWNDDTDTTDAGETATNFAVSVTGPGITFATLPTETDAKGTATFARLLGSNDSGVIVITVSYDQNDDGDYSDATDLVVSKSITIGAAAAETPRVAAFTKRAGDKIQIVSQGSAKVRFMLNGKRVASRQSLGTLNRTFDLVDGKNVIEIYVDGKRVLRRAATK